MIHRSRARIAVIVTLAILAFILILAPYIAPFDPTQVKMEERLKPISMEHLLGTDHLGRDVFSRILTGAQTTVGASFLILFISLLVGVPFGLLSGYLGGKIDRIFMRIVDAFMTFPDYIVAIILSGFLGPGMFNLVLAIVMVKWVGYARLARSVVLTEKQKDYISMAKINGMSSLNILRRHMIPHVTGNVMVLATLDIGKIILMIASLSYIGLGAQPPAPEWGAMLNEAKGFFYNAPQLMLIPGLSIMMVVLIFNLLGDYLRDHFDVKNQKG
ncbi:nickel transporter permease [Jeotgalibacillus soli]|uniref:Oligopeptide ABC transporter permease n=1 Tax=Jeotgalibacillus soli TaxID=889306 RepID=A0A0C2VK58_9BACL|nr:nickel transporter permease [Jeotgalibacillus soli]KIL49297.1 oligopeptide ABC transporter permease [Jeotgalibacillus soli]